MEFINTLMKLEGNRMHGSLTKRLSGDAWKDAVATAAVYTVFIAGIPLVRANWHHIQQHMQASGITFFYRLGNTYETTIRFQKPDRESFYYGQPEAVEDSEEGKRNNILQKAILLYIGHADLHYRRSLAFLTAVKQKPAATKGDGVHRYRRPVPKVYGGSADQLKRFSINIAPPEQIWVEVDKENGVWFKQTKDVEKLPETEASSKSSSRRAPPTIIDYTFRCAGPEGHEKVKNFITDAYAWYTKEMESTEDNARYMYSLVAAKEPPKKKGASARYPIGMGYEEGDPKKKEESSPIIYKRFKLGDVKDFDSLFFPEKEKLLRALENFEAKRGRYAIRGYPYKLGLLLHGPPGTGKTSLIKALACRTGRHIIQVPLGRIKTNEDLMNIMFDQSFRVATQELPVPLKHENVIYVFEDVDAASKIVKARKSIINTDDNSSSSSSSSSSKGDDSEEYADAYDKLDLSGLLNVLDGVVDTPGRLVVVTTNIVDCLDPALIRPGRVDQKILLGYMRYDAALAMTKHFFPEESESLTDEQKNRLQDVFSDEAVALRRRPASNYGGGDRGELTPATMEKVLGEHEKVDDFLEALEAFALEKPASGGGGGGGGGALPKDQLGLTQSSGVAKVDENVEEEEEEEGAGETPVLVPAGFKDDD